MAYTDDYVKTNWVNYPSTNTPLNQTNLNHAEGGIKTNCGRIANLDTTKANQSDLLLTVKNVAFDNATGIFTFTLWNNTTITVDTDIEKVAVNFTYDDDPTSPHYQNLVLELSDGTYKYIDMSALITQYEFTSTSTIAFTVGVGGEITANVVDGTITANKLQPNYLADCQAAQTGAQNAKAAADADALKAEGFANGTQNSTPVTSGSPYYENNAKYWKEQAQQIASQSLGGLTDVNINAPANGDTFVYDSTDSKWRNQHVTTSTVTNNPISITTQSAQVARDTKITLTPIQAAGTPTPANPLPIGGYDSVSLDVTGTNVWDEETIANKYYTAGGIVSGNDFIASKNPIAVMPNKTYFISAPKNFDVYGGNDNSGTSLTLLLNGGKNTTFTTGATTKFIYFSSASTDYGTTYNNDISINYPSIDTTYHAYIPATQITNSLPTTIYGGEVDVERGVLKVTYERVDMGDLNWSYYATYSMMYASLSQGKTYTTQSLFCTAYAYGGYNTNLPDMATAADLTVWKRFSDDLGSNATNVYIIDTNYSDPATFKTAMTGQKIVYELATPYEIQLTPYEVNLLQGANVITSNGTSVTFTYREGTIATLEDIPSETVNKLADMVADVQGDISTLDSTKTDLSAIAPIENGTTASQAYAVGEYFVKDGNFCRCISAISNGSAFTLNTNYIVTKVGTQMTKSVRQTSGTLDAKLRANQTAMATLGDLMLRDAKITNTPVTIGGNASEPEGSIILVYE